MWNYSIKKLGKICFLKLELHFVGNTTFSGTICTLPEGWRPLFIRQGYIGIASADYSPIFRGYVESEIQTDGKIFISTVGTNGDPSTPISYSSLVQLTFSFIC